MLRKWITKAAMPIMVLKGKKDLRYLQKSSFAPMEENLKLLRKIIRKNRNTEYGKLHHFDQIKNPEDFRRNVPISTYDDFSDYVERTKLGEQNLLTKAKILGYSRTSGSSGVPKYIPATLASLNAYTRYTWTRALALGAQELERQGKHYRAGRGVYLSPATNETLPNGTPCSNIAEIAARRFGIIYPYILTIPQREMFDMYSGDYIYNVYRFALEDEDASFIFSVFMSINVSQLAYLKEHWQVIVDDIEKGIISDSIPLKPEVRAQLEPLVRPNPKRAAYLRQQFLQGFDSTLLKRLWPNMTVICGIGGASFKPAADTVAALSAGIPMDFSIYGASEGLIAACYELNNSDMQLLVDSCFFEFIPQEPGEPEIVTLDQLQLGKKYEVIITSQAGFYRYRLKDVIEVKGFRNKCPIISFVYRKGQLLNLAGEKFSEEDARNTIERFCKAHNTQIDHWILYQDASVSPSRYALLAEYDESLHLEDCIDELEQIMTDCSRRYGAQRAKSFIGRLTVQRQIPGTHRAWAERCVEQGASIAQVKPVHSLDNDTKREFFLSRIAPEQ